jgi:hypothetical protein
VQDLLHVVEVDHPFHDIEQNLDLLKGGKLLLFLVQLVKKTPILQILGNQCVLAGSDAHPHVKYYVRMLQVTNNLQFLHEVLLVSVLACLQVVLDCNQLPYIFSFVDFPKTTLSN